jgi:hypothetical protein
MRLVYRILYVTNARLPLVGGIVREVAAELTLALGGVMPGTKTPRASRAGGRLVLPTCWIYEKFSTWPSSRPRDCACGRVRRSRILDRHAALVSHCNAYLTLVQKRSVASAAKAR